MMRLHNAALLATIFLVIGLGTACGDDDDSSPDAPTDFEEIGFDQQGLQPDPLAGDDWPAAPDTDDIPSCMQGEIDLITNGDRRLLLFESDCNGDEYFYRAPVLDMLDDDQFEVAVYIMAARTDRMGKAQYGPTNGASDGQDSYNVFQSMVYDPDAQVYDPDADFDEDANHDHISAQIDDGLAQNDDDELMVDLVFQPTVRSWQHYVDVLDPDEVDTEDIAEQVGQDRRDTYAQDLLEISTEAVENTTGCQEVAASSSSHRAIYTCTPDQVDLLTALSMRVIDVEFVDEVPYDLNPQQPPQGTNNATNSGD